MIYENNSLDGLKNKIRSLTPDELQSKGILSAAHGGGFICPACGNGSGDDGTGIDFSPAEGTHVSHCFRCGADFDIIKVLAVHFGLDTHTDFREILTRAASLFGVSESISDQDDAEKDFSKMINYARGNLMTLVRQYGDGASYRGIKTAILQRHKVGFSPKFGREQLPRVIIPTGKSHILARLVGDCSDKTVAQKQHLGKKDIFNFDALANSSADEKFFLVEGEFDAMSIEQCGFNAIAISGSDITKRMKDQFASVVNKPQILVMLDADRKDVRDKDGKTQPEKAVDVLQKLGYASAFTFLPEVVDSRRLKDANDFLCFSPSLLSRNLEELAKAGCEYGAKSKLLKYDEEKRGRKMWSAELFGNCPVNVKVPEGYEVAGDGIKKLFYKRGQIVGEEIICDTPIFVSKKMFNQDGEEARCEVAYLHGGWKKFQIKMSEICDSRTFGHNFADRGIALTSGGASKLARYFVEMFFENKDNLPEKKYYNQTGWKDGKFVYPEGEDSDNYVVRGNFDYEKAFAEVGSEEESRKILMSVTSNSSTARLTIGAGCAAPLVRILGARNAQLHLYPKSESGKSALLKAVMSIFGNPMELCHTFSATQKSLDDAPANFNDLPLWTDELQSAPKFVRENMDEFIYNYENGQTRLRLTKEGEAKPTYKFRGVRLTTGEQRLTNFASGQGAKNRVIELALPYVLDKKTAVYIHETFDDPNKTTYGHLGRKLIHWCERKENQKKLSEKFSEMKYLLQLTAAQQNGYTGELTRDALRGLSSDVIGLTASHVQMLSLFFTGFWAFAQSCFDSDLAEACDDFILQDVSEIVGEFINQRENSAAERALPVLMDIVESREAQFYRLDRQGHKVGNITGGRALGIIAEGGKVYFNNLELRNLLKDEYGFNYEDVVRGLSDCGLLDEDNCDAHKHQKSVSYVDYNTGERKKVWMLVLKADSETLLEEKRREKIADASRIY